MGGGKGRVKVGGVLGKVVDGVGEGVVDGDDDCVGLGEGDGFVVFESFWGGVG